ncbi:hypothetical protein OS493_003228 [Desmophyllum pertusum]|uniref:Uncharacterized protein n=1 Tax=Desmophyllum pertusum TaxID=174260 RepID=A0A9X0CJ06_9CNID|nr:hypothetical protein OS493_003228 [Desmophyllum pertusum]
MPLSSADVSLTLSDEDAENQACAELDRRNNINRLLLRIEEHLKGDESEDINLGLLHAEEPPPRNRIIEIAKQVLKACGYVLGAVVAVPLIAGPLFVLVSPWTKDTAATLASIPHVYPYPQLENKDLSGVDSQGEEKKFKILF